MPRVEIPLIGPHYTNREKPLSAQRAVNMWPEVNPEARNQVCLHNTAGTKTFATLSGPDRGMHDFNNLMYAVNGSYLFSIDADGQDSNLGYIGGADRCVMADDGYQLIIVTGGTPYRYTVAGGVEAITDPDLVNPTSVAYINNQFVFDNNNGTWGEFVTSSIGEGLSIDSLDFATAEAHPDDIVRIMSFRQLLYFFGSHSVEPWQNTGVGNPPFARVNSGVQQYGLAGTHAVVATSEYMYFLDNKRIPRRSNGLAFPSIGNPSLGVEFATYSRIDDCIAMEYTQDNQQFVVFTFPTADKTWAFHEVSGTWFQMTFSGVVTDSEWQPETPPTESPPTPPAQEDSNEIVSPFWENTGTWVDLTALTNTTYEALFGVTVEGADFNSVFTVGDGQAALVTTTDAANRIQIQDSTDCTNAALYITDASGSVIDTMIYNGVPNGDSVMIPADGANYYVVITSDTGTAKIKKWDSTSVVTAGSVAWETISGGYAFGGRAFLQADTYIPDAGLSVRFTVPSTSDVVSVAFGANERAGSIGTIQYSISDTVGDINATPNGQVSVGHDYTYCGINLAGTEKDLIPGNTYFLNLKWISGGGSQFIYILHSYNTV